MISVMVVSLLSLLGALALVLRRDWLHRITLYLVILCGVGIMALLRVLG
jgi:hypothetical protein